MTIGSPKSARWAAPSSILALVLYPYVFLTARASFLRQSTSQLEVARTLGRTAWGAFFSVALPLARPAIAVGVSLAMMECLNDIGAAGFFGIRTLSVGIYTTWLAEGNLGGASQIAAVMLIFVFAFLWIERLGRQQQSFAPSARKAPSDPARSRLKGWRAACGLSCLRAAGASRFHRARRSFFCALRCTVSATA